MLRFFVERLMNMRCCCVQEAAAYRTVLYPNYCSEAPGRHAAALLAAYRVISAELSRQTPKPMINAMQTIGPGAGAVRECTVNHCGSVPISHGSSKEHNRLWRNRGRSSPATAVRHDRRVL